MRVDSKEELRLKTAAQSMFGTACDLEVIGLDQDDLEILEQMGYSVCEAGGLFWIPPETPGTYYIGGKSGRREEYRYLELSDLHVGMKDCALKILRYVLRVARDQGIQWVHLSGDLIEGYYPEHNGNLQFSDPEDQVRFLADILTCYPFHYLAIKGNHELSMERAGFPNPLVLLAALLPKFSFLNCRCGNLLIGGVLKQVTHLCGSPVDHLGRLSRQCGLMLPVGPESYRLRLLQAGHRHCSGVSIQKGVRISQPGCFLAASSRKSRIGGRITRIVVQDGRLLSFDSTFLNGYKSRSRQPRKRQRRYAAD